MRWCRPPDAKQSAQNAGLEAVGDDGVAAPQTGSGRGRGRGRGGKGGGCGVDNSDVEDAREVAFEGWRGREKVKVKVEWRRSKQAEWWAVCVTQGKRQLFSILQHHAADTGYERCVGVVEALNPLAEDT